MKTYDPLLHLLPEDLELLELQLPRVVHLVHGEGKHFAEHSCVDFKHHMSDEGSLCRLKSNYSRLLVWKDTSIRLMMLWQVLRLRPSNLISFPGSREQDLKKSGTVINIFYLHQSG